MPAKYVVDLTDDERVRLHECMHSGPIGARKLRRVRTLLLADEGLSDQEIVDALETSLSTVHRTRERFVEGGDNGVDWALSDAPRPGGNRKTTGKEDALLIATACSQPPEGRCRWTLELLQGALVALTGKEVSDELVRRRLQESQLKPWQQRMWCIPKVDADYVAAMEDVLDTYALPADPDCPLVCFDETPYQLVAETREPLPMKPGAPAIYDYEYRRAGTANLFIVLAPHRGWRRVEVTAHRGNRDFALQMKQLVDIDFPEAKRIRVVLDNVNTHRPGALYDALPAEEARRILRKLEFHYTPKHGSWLNMAECEIAVLQKQCLARRIGEREVLCHEVSAWQRARNAAGATVRWQFTVEQARTKFTRGYPGRDSEASLASSAEAPVRTPVGDEPGCLTRGLRGCNVTAGRDARGTARRSREPSPEDRRISGVAPS
jgi:transposase